MLKIAPPLFRKHRGRAARRGKSTAIAGPILTAATYDHVALTLTLTFDRAINVDLFDGAAIGVDDPDFNGLRYRANSAVTLLGPQMLRTGLDVITTSSGLAVMMTAGPGNGVVAVSDGAEWAGATVDLPF